MQQLTWISPKKFISLTAKTFYPQELDLDLCHDFQPISTIKFNVFLVILFEKQFSFLCYLTLDGFAIEDVTFGWIKQEKKKPLSMDDSINLPQYKITKTETVVCTRNYSTGNIHVIINHRL